MSDKRFYKVIVVAMTILIIMLVVGTAGAILAAQTENVWGPFSIADCRVVIENDEAWCERDVTEPTPTPEPTDAPTATPEPTNTPTPEPDGEVRDGVPLCESHDDTAWHPVYDAAQDCHYDHQHGRNPYDAQIVALLGQPDALTGQGISYPWQTPRENELKHRAYFWVWQVNDECVFSFGELCVEAYRVQLHADMGIVGYNALTHSFYAELLACDEAGECGIAKFGGHIDTGFSYSPYFGECVDVPANPGTIDECPSFSNSLPYRVLPDLAEMANARDADSDSSFSRQSARVLWGMQSYRNLLLVFRNLDAWAAVNPDDWTEWEYGCDDFQCRFNGSLTNVINIVSRHAQGSFVGFTDVRGNVDDSCVEASASCVPYVLEDWPGGRAVYASGAQFPGDHPQDPKNYYEFDQSPAALGVGAEWWLVPTNEEPLP